MSVLINKKAVKVFALHVSKFERGGKFTRVSAEFLEAIDYEVRCAVRKRISQHPSIGVTLK